MHAQTEDGACLRNMGCELLDQGAVEFSELAQEGWGVSYKFDPSHITGISIQVKGPDDTDSLAIDDVYLITSP